MSFFMLLKCSLNSLSILVTIALNSVPGSLLAYISFNTFFLETSPILSLGTYFFAFLFWLPPYFCFYVLGRAAMSPGLGRVALYSRCPIGSGVTAFLVIWAECSRCSPCGLCVLSCCSWALIAVGTSVGGIDAQADQLWVPATTTEELVLCRGWPYRAGLPSVGLWYPLSPPLVCVSQGVFAL